MILDSKKNNYIKRLPFSATFDDEKMEVVFSEGHIFDCYNYEANPNGRYKNGSHFIKTTNHGQAFKVVKGDKFYVDFEGEIFKVAEGEDAGRGVLIWEAPTDEKGYEQGLSENLFLQDYEANREKGFSVKKIREDASTSYYRINSGFVFAPQVGFTKFIEGYEFAEPKDSEFIFVLKVKVKAEVSDLDPIGDANINFIKSYGVTSATLEKKEVDFLDEYNEDEGIKLMEEEDRLDGTYYALVTGNGNVHLNFNIVDEERVEIRPAVRTQVRGAKLWKNGINFSSPEDQIEPEYYKEVTKTETFLKFTQIDDDAVPSGTYVRKTKFYVEGPSAIPDPPVVLIEVEDPGELPSDQFIVDVGDVEYEASGPRTDSALGRCAAISGGFDWTDENVWASSFEDQTALVDGAGFSKSGAQVTYAERRFQRAALPDVFSENLPSSYMWYGGYTYFYTGDFEEINANLGLNLNEGLYIAEGFIEIPHSSEDSDWGKEYLSLDCAVQVEYNGYSKIDVTRFVYESYQQLVMTSNADSVV